jgi:hypothetical protein
MGSSILGIPELATNQASPEFTVNGAINALDQAMNRQGAFATGDADVTIAIADFISNVFLDFTGADTADRNVTIPSLNADGNPLSRLFVVRNSTTGGFDLIFTTGAGTTERVSAAAGAVLLYSDGTNIIALKTLP